MSQTDVSDNSTSQNEEIEALSSIYGVDWRTEDLCSKTYSVDINVENEEAVLSVTFPPEYPSHAPPIYTLTAPWFRGKLREDLNLALDEIYLENIGQTVVYQWVEKVRAFLIENSAAAVVASSEFSPKKSPKKVSEVKNDMVCPEIFHGDTLTDRKSIFQPHLAFIKSKYEVQLVMRKLRENKKIDAATHNIFAYRIMEEFERKQVKSEQSLTGYREVNGCEDDGEIHAGGRLLHLLSLVDARDVIVIVTRWYGGVHLGPDRFKHINGCARTILDAHGCIKQKEASKSRKSK